MQKALRVLIPFDGFNPKLVEEALHHFKSTQAVPFKDVEFYLKAKDRTFHVEQLASAFGCHVYNSGVIHESFDGYILRLHPKARPDKMDTISVLKNGLDKLPIKAAIARQISATTMKPHMGEMLDGEPWVWIEPEEEPLMILTSPESLRKNGFAIPTEHFADHIAPSKFE